MQIKCNIYADTSNNTKLMQNKCTIYANTSNNHVNQTKQMQNKCNRNANTNNNHTKICRTNAKQMQHICKDKE